MIFVVILGRLLVRWKSFFEFPIHWIKKKKVLKQNWEKILSQKKFYENKLLEKLAEQSENEFRKSFVDKNKFFRENIVVNYEVNFVWMLEKRWEKFHKIVSRFS